MPAPLGIRSALFIQVAGAALVLLSQQQTAVAQPVVFGFERPLPTEFSAARVVEISGAKAARLEQAEALAANESWGEAIDALRALVADDDGRVVPLGNDRFLSLKKYCDLQIARWPAEGLAAYRRRVDPQAERWYRDGLRDRDEESLRRVVDEAFCSSWTDDALLALGELALERADFATARRAWEQISSLARDPMGRPMWLALEDLDFDARWPEIEKRWNQRSEPSDWLAYPETDLDLAEVRARLILASVRAGELERAAIELAAFRRFHPNASGSLTGQKGNYIELLERLIASALAWPPTPSDMNWPTFGGAPSRMVVAEELSPTIGRVWTKSFAARELKIAASDAERDEGTALNLFSVTYGETLVVGDSDRLRAWNLATGEPAITKDGVLYRAESTDGESLRVPLNQSSTAARNPPRFTLTIADGNVFARVGRIDTYEQQVDPGPIVERLVGLDLRRDGLLTLQIKPDDPSWAFDGAPLCDGRRLFVAMRHSEITPQAYVAAFDAATGKRLWRTSIGGADTLVDSIGREATSNLLTLAGGRLYFNSNLGLVAALEIEHGQIEWLRRYPRATNLNSNGAEENAFLQRIPSPCVYSSGLLFVAPSDSPSIFALDADTGHAIWWNDQLTDALHLLGVVDDNLVVSGTQLWTLSAATGRVCRVWPESKHAGVRGMGRGVVAGREVFWPTRKEILVFDVASGLQTRPPIDLTPEGDNGANLIVARGYLVAAGAQTLTAFGPQRVRRAPAEPNESSSTEGPIADLD